MRLYNAACSWIEARAAQIREQPYEPDGDPDVTDSIVPGAIRPLVRSHKLTDLDSRYSADPDEDLPSMRT